MTTNLPPPTTQIGSSLVPASDVVTITIKKTGKQTKAQAVYHENGDFDCWYTDGQKVYWRDEVSKWQP